MKMTFLSSLKSILTIAIFALCLPFVVSAQDEIEKSENLTRANLDKTYADRVKSLKPAQATRLQSIQKEVEKIQGASFKVSATEALDRTPAELLGVKEATKMSAAELDANDKEFKAAVQAAEPEVKAKRVAGATNPIEQGGVGAPVSFNFPGSPVKNQGGCGSCWAFAAAAAWEASYKKFYGTVKNMSEQELLACGKTCGGTDAGSCNGGWSDRALDHIKCRSTPTEAVYPYNIANGNSCVAKAKVYGAYSWGALYSPSAATLKTQIQAYGSVVTYMRAGLNSFYAYSGGVYNGYPNTSVGDIDHAVIITGWNDVGGYWIIKNSWGTGWGINGRAYIKYGHCNIGGYNYYVYPKP